MSVYDNIRFEAHAGDTIHITATVTDTRGAQVMLFDGNGYEAFRKSETDGNPFIEFTDSDTIHPPGGDCQFEIPEDGVWHIVYLPWAVSTFSTQLQKKNS